MFIIYRSILDFSVRGQHTDFQGVADADYTIISRRDAENAVVMSLDQFNGLMETVHLLKNPANARHLEESIQEYRSGKIENHDLIDD